MTRNVLKTTAAIAALIATPAFAGSMSDKPEDTAIDSQVGTATLATAEMLANETQEGFETAIDTADAATSDMDDMDAEPMTVAEIIGTNVLTASDETVGEIDYVIKSADGYAAVIGIGGFLGLGEYTVALPLEQFDRTGDGELRLATWSEAELEALPEIDESELESLPSDYEINMSS
ncbi:PRC-barrel domain-containing protein [uncultured Tateyamaria sp.]|uniref:PRC-barrel domain-containing protein n=1 Tax=uncultured Tateyamaria sp. TaxID=455651 RepID=UPI00260EB0D8|nr:PRC-barrel domain-containing protein [uncultured Tateyamaria sp.]